MFFAQCTLVLELRNMSAKLCMTIVWNVNKINIKKSK